MVRAVQKCTKKVTNASTVTSKTLEADGRLMCQVHSTTRYHIIVISNKDVKRDAELLSSLFVLIVTILPYITVLFARQIGKQFISA
jgi:hypothetical protein